MARDLMDDGHERNRRPFRNADHHLRACYVAGAAIATNRIDVGHNAHMAKRKTRYFRAQRKREPMTGLEPVTSSLPRTCSTN